MMTGLVSARRRKDRVPGGGVERFAGLVVVAMLLPLTARHARADEVAPANGGIATPSQPLIGWLAAGLGVGGVGTQVASARRLEAAFGRGSRLLSIRYSYFEDTNVSCEQSGCFDSTVSLPRSSDKELAVQYGIAKRFYAGLATASLGVAGLRTLKRGSHLLSTDELGTTYHYDSTNQWTAGVTAEAGAYLSSRFLSFGPTFVADLNPAQPAWGILLDLHVGWMGAGPKRVPTSQQLSPPSQLSPSSNR